VLPSKQRSIVPYVFGVALSCWVLEGRVIITTSVLAERPFPWAWSPDARAREQQYMRVLQHCRSTLPVAATSEALVMLLC
jgi:hypothetical protein